MLYKVPFYISSAKSTLTAWSWNKPVILQILSFLEPVRYNTAFLSFSPHPSASSGKKKKKKKYSAALVEAGGQTRVEVSVHQRKGLHLYRKTKPEVEDCY